MGLGLCLRDLAAHLQPRGIEQRYGNEQDESSEFVINALGGRYF